MSEIKRLSPKEFRDQGYLADVNRLYFHPLGMALEVIIDEEGVKFGGVWDYRDDAEGMSFHADDWTPEKVDIARALQIDCDRDEKAAKRLERLGYIVQPLPKDSLEEVSKW